MNRVLFWLCGAIVVIVWLYVGAYCMMVERVRQTMPIRRIGPIPEVLKARGELPDELVFVSPKYRLENEWIGHFFAIAHRADKMILRPDFWK